MSKSFLIALVLSFSICQPGYSNPDHHQHSLDLKDQSSPIRSMGSMEYKGLYTGKGMGMAKAAELNNYPGPLHVLELAEILGLTEKTEAAIQVIFDDMRQRSIIHGKKILEQEGHLNTLFENGKASRESVTTIVGRIAQLRGELRLIHLLAHLKVKPLLTSQQIERYNQVRNYR